MRVFAFRKQPGGLFLAKSGEPGTEMPCISVGEPSVCKAQPQQTPNPFRRTKNTRVAFTALVFLLYLGCRDSNPRGFLRLGNSPVGCF